MKIVSNNSQEIKDMLKEKKIWVENKSILSMLNGRESFNIIRNSEVEKFSGIDSLNLKGDLVIFDLLNEVKLLKKIRSNYFLEDEYEKIKSEIKEVFQRRVENIDPLNFSESFLREIYRIYINMLSTNFYNKKIILLSLRINEEVKIIGEERIQLNDNEKDEILLINEFLKTIEWIFKNMLPDIQIVKINNDVIIKDFKKRKFFVEEKEIDIEKNNLYYKSFLGEKQFASFNTIRYFLEKGKIYNKEKLIIIFSSFPTDAPKYNYINSLKNIDCNKLFILDDYGSKGSYYLGLGGNFDVETSIMSLITRIISENGISFKNVISVGSSKGGSAALYYGMKYNFGNIVIGAPQYRIGTYLNDLSIKDYGKEIFGEISEMNRLKYDNIIRLVANNHKGKVKLLTSDGDNQYKKILKDFEHFAKSFNLNLQIKKCDIKSHGEIAKVFPDYMNNEIKEILGSGYVNINVVLKLKKQLNKILK